MYFNETVKPLILKADELCKRHNRDFEIHFTSNAFLLYDATIKFLSNYSCSFQITLDGHRDRHNTVRYNDAGGSYDTILNNIISLAQSGIRVLVRINCTRSNVDDLVNILQDFKRGIKPDTANMLSFDIQRVWQDIDIDVNSETESEINNKISDYIKLYRDNGYRVNSVLISNKVNKFSYGDKTHHATIN